MSTHGVNDRELNCKVTWNFDVGLPSVVVASSIKLHIFTKGIAKYREAV